MDLQFFHARRSCHERVSRVMRANLVKDAFHSHHLFLSSLGSTLLAVLQL